MLDRRAPAKPERGEYRLKQKAKRRELVNKEDAIKADSKRRDGHRCRWFHETPEEERECRDLRKDSAHIGHKGMGGDKQLLRTKRELLVTMGLRCHDRFDKRGDRRVVFLTKDKADGIIACEVKRGGRWVEIGREISIGVWA